jgi:glycosyltransferase involved in cell wall biosynthesis
LIPDHLSLLSLLIFPMSAIPIVIFAQVPPPEHGQSRMVALALATLRERPQEFEIHHINARFSTTLDDIGDSSLAKLGLVVKYLVQAARTRLRTHRPILYYVPGPVKWSSVLRDWALLGVLRRFYPRVVFHWHAIGHGEWAHGSQRLFLDGPRWLDHLARRISASILDAPYASIAVSENSQKDSHAVRSMRALVICNGIEDPCPDFEHEPSLQRFREPVSFHPPEQTEFRILFLSHGTLEKGAIDALDGIAFALEKSEPSWKFKITFAGGISEDLAARFDKTARELLSKWPDRVQINQEGYLTGQDKHRCYLTHDIFLAPSRWESFGLTVTEAMAHGLPVVAAASDGVKGVLPDDYPYLSPVENPQALAANLLACCADLGSPSSLNLSRSLRERYRSLFQINNFANHLTHAFLELGAGAASAPPAVPVTDRRYSPDSLTATSKLWSAETPTLHLAVYLADQNPGFDRSFGISRMSQVVLKALKANGNVDIKAVTSITSQQIPNDVGSSRMLPWGTRGKLIRFLTDHFHPLFTGIRHVSDIWYFPKGYLPLLTGICRPSVVTIHDTIVQYDEDHYPTWRNAWEYRYWAMMLKHTLRKADRILTVSESSKRQIEVFMERHQIPTQEIDVTYEPCAYEEIPQPMNPDKENYVIHLASVEPHKRTAHLIRWWQEAESRGRKLPRLHLIGSVPPEVTSLLASSHNIVKGPFLDDSALQSAYRTAKAIILSSEIEGFGLPALEAYYLGTPVCFVKGTSVEEILGVATAKGGFSLDDMDTLSAALDEVTAMSPEEVRACGLKLRETYAATKVVARMLSAFRCLTIP